MTCQPATPRYFDNWRGPPIDEPLGKDLEAFIAEVRACSPSTRVVVPKHFDRMLGRERVR